jgi:hypothetical protein
MAPHLAVLLSGQLVRLHTPQLEALAQLQLHAWPTGVHVVLSNTNYTRSGSSPAVDPEPELSGLDDAARETALRQKLRALRFAPTTVRILAETALAARMVALDTAAAAANATLWRATASMRRQVVHGNIVRWTHNGRMLYLRHLAFAAAWNHARGVTYTHFLCVREDNAFLSLTTPLPAEAHAMVLAAQPHRPPTRGRVLLDAHCGTSPCGRSNPRAATRQPCCSLRVCAHTFALRLLCVLVG